MEPLPTRLLEMFLSPLVIPTVPRTTHMKRALALGVLVKRALALGVLVVVLAAHCPCVAVTPTISPGAAFSSAFLPPPRVSTMPSTKRAARESQQSSTTTRNTRRRVGRMSRELPDNDRGEDRPTPARLASGDELVGISRRLHERLRDRKWKGTSKQPVSCSYNVLEYASETNEAYTRRYGGGRPLGRAFVVGMNPGPWGMVQTGVPFGEVGFVRDWLGVHGEVGRPSKEHAKRPVDGFACKRSEVSGTRLWGFFERRFGTADAWGDKMFVYNFCPLTFMTSSGGNITPDKLTPAERKIIDEACGDALADMMSALKPSVVVAVGNFAGGKCAEAVKTSGLGAGEGEAGVEVVVVNHPSPASPSGIKWQKAVCLNELVLNSSKCKEVDRFLL